MTDPIADLLSPGHCLVFGSIVHHLNLWIYYFLDDLYNSEHQYH